MAQVQEVFLFQPTSITGCQLWLDGADPAGTGILPANGATVSTWVDKSGNARNSPANSTGAIFAANSLNGRGTINFTAQGRYYVTPNFVPSSANAPSIFVVAQQTGYTSGNSEIVIATVGSPTWATFDLFGSAGTFIARLNMYNNQGENGGISIAAPAIISIVGSGAPSFSASMFGNGTLNITFTGNSGNPLSTSMGFNIGSSAGFIGNIYDVIMYNTALSTLQRQQIEGYLAWKWGLQANLPSDHPFKTYRPLAQTPIPTQIVPMPTRGQTIQAFAPTQISGCQLWLDGADPAGSGILPANGDTVSTWIDKSGNGFNATAAPSRTAGTYSTSFRAVNFPTSTTGYITNYTAAPTNETMFVVFNNPTASYNNNILIGGVQGARSLGAGYSGNGGNIVGVVGNLNTQVAWLARTDLGSYTLGTTALVTSQFTTSTNTISLNGGTAGSGGAPGFTAGRVTYLGVDATNGSYYYVGYAMEIIFYNSVLNTTQRQQVEGYLAWKWGLVSSLPNGHPYKQQQIAPFPFRITPFRGSLNQWQPTQISGCQLWLDATETATVIRSGSAVSQWTDKIGNTNVTQASASLQPTYLSSGFNGRPTLQFTGVQGSSYNVLTSASTGLYNSITSLNFFSVSRVISPAPNYPSPFSIQNKVSFYLNGLNNSSGFVGTNIWTYQGTGFVANQNTSFPYDTNTLSCLSLGTTQQFFLNGSNTISSPSFTFGSGTNLTINIGYSGYNANDGFNGYISEVIVYTTSLTTAQRQNVEGYLAWKWGLQGSLPSTHPYKNLPPPPS
jgi:hypothetical protein